MTALMPIFAARSPQLIAFDSVPSFDPFRGNPADLIRYIEAKEPRAIGSWNELGRDEYARAFTAAQSAGLNVIDDLYFAFVDVIEQGGTERDYAAMVVPMLKAKGWLRGDDGQIARRVALIYDTNLRMAQSSGQWDRIQAGKLGLPYIRAVTARDGRVRHPPKSDADHRAWEGIILPVDHPFWRRWWIPLGFRCRCGVIAMSRSQFVRHGYSITTDVELAHREAQLGTPIFAAPGGGTAQQIAAIADAENTDPDRMPGLPFINVAERRAEGSRAWGVLTQGLAIESLLANLFG